MSISLLFAALLLSLTGVRMWSYQQREVQPKSLADRS
jgi:hypothetical protein